MEKSGRLLQRAQADLFCRGERQQNPAAQDPASQAPKLAAHNDAIFLDAKLFQRVTAIYKDRQKPSILIPNPLRLVEYYYKDSSTPAQISLKPTRPSSRS